MVPLRALSCIMTTRKGGYQSRSSRSHCRSTVAGHTIRLGRKLPLACRPARNTAIWMVLPNPAPHALSAFHRRLSFNGV